MIVRSVVQIDEEKCDGCGRCVPSCEEGAIQIVDGKVRVVSDSFCDGLGACLGHCPRGAITLVQREAESSDESLVARHRAGSLSPSPTRPTAPGTCSSGACPGTAPTTLGPAACSAQTTAGETDAERSGLRNWPVQLHLVSPHAAQLRHADLLLVADCVPFAYARFHQHFLDGRPVIIGCPKLDDCQAYVAKLATICRQAAIRSISVVHMEMPCCLGLMCVVEQAMQLSGVRVPVWETVVTRSGEIRVTDPQRPGAATAPQTVARATNGLPIL